MPYNVVTKSPRAPTIAKPGAKGNERPVAQQGGGGNKARGSVEPTAANSPTVSVSPTNVVTTEHFGPSPQQQRQARRARVQVQQSKQRVRKVVRSLVSEPTPKREVHVSADFLKNAASPKPVTVAAHTRALPGATKPSVPVAKHQRTLPKASAVAGPDLLDKVEAKQRAQQVKQVQAKVAKAKQQVAQSAGVQGPLTASQKKIAQIVASKTDLKPRTVATQELQEMSGEHATQRDAEHNFDTLNIGMTDSGPLALTRDPEFRTVKGGANAIVKFLKGQKYGAEGGIPDILAKAEGKSVEGQLNVIGNSGWATSAYAEDLKATSALVSEKHDPQAAQHLKAALKEAKELHIDPKVGPGPAPKPVVKKYKQALSTMSQINKKGYEYQWGGGHAVAGQPTGGPGTGFDCSGAVSAMLHSVGDLDAPLTSGEMGSVLKPGVGAITVFYNSEHTFAYIPARHEYWGTSESNPGGGAGYFPKSVGDSEVASGNEAGAYNVGHVPGLGKKQALQLGALPGSLTPSGTSSSTEVLPGMTLSADGTTATIDPSAGTKVDGKSSFSKKPIELTAHQQIERNKRKLRTVGEAFEPSEEAASSKSSSLHQQLEALESKYSVGAV